MQIDPKDFVIAADQQHTDTMAVKRKGSTAVKPVASPRNVGKVNGRTDKTIKKATKAVSPEAEESDDDDSNVIPLNDEGDQDDDDDDDDFEGVSSGEDQDSEAEEEEDDDEAALLAGFTDDEGANSSDEDDEDDRKAAGVISVSGVVKLPSSKDDAVVRARLDKVSEKRQKAKASGKAVPTTKPIVLYFGRVPKSMPEDALRAYLTQFGDIRRLRLARNRTTGATKHYAFVEFEDEDVGQIVQETMHNYLLEGRLLQVQIVPKEKQHPNLWIGANRKYRKVPADKRFKAMHDKIRTSEQKDKAEKNLLKRQEQRRQKIKADGIDYDFEGFKR